MQTPYDADYFLRGKETGVSNYTDYRWLETETMALARRVVEVMDIKPGDTFFDYGCARGYLVKAMRRLGVDAWGCDISQWAIENCDAEVKRYVSCGSAASLGMGTFDHVWMKDVAEHLEPLDLAMVLNWMVKAAQKSILLIVPLARGGGDFTIDRRRYVRDEDNQDKTHIIRWTLEEWMEFVWGAADHNEWQLQGSWHIPGLKPASLSPPKSCGFITLRQI